MLAKEHRPAARLNPVSPGWKASALQAETNILTDVDFVAQSSGLDMRGWCLLNALLQGVGAGLLTRYPITPISVSQDALFYIHFI
jgi:hypothetical protein